MPELPEVETVARDLQRWVAGARITGAEVRWARTIRHPEPDQFSEEIRGAEIQRVGRRAKSVLIHLADGRVMTVALRMTGALIVAPAGTPDDPYARVVFGLADGRQLRYRDVRKFGRIGLWEGGGLTVRRTRRPAKRRVKEARAPYRVGDVFGRHGPEPLARGFSAARLAERLKGRSARLKTLLLDQSFIAGVGNIYADEALWRARLHPMRKADSLAPDEVRRLHRAIRSVLRQGIANRGASFADYVGADGEPGANAEELAVYRRTGEPCLRCGRTIQRVVIGQRSTHFCPHCQPAPQGEETA
ncbi:MAG TPA: bifunctional DNA-formamidopyrimidine glycosylase/DNA-(apurinic or apyrimidinic site) lyase [Candidatus Limnocylindria bacterium]|jgi:formamidopyrimidine-DNA glycosylase|nr:bifunctional DNA-formamidopyrimidine glycosylase/DNA-(apurinic or apyrimidinic site) lyase [Candidatus Limnocylindria bacterium]